MRPYTKAQLEELLWKQLSYIDALNDKVRLLEEQNVIYETVNKKLTTEHLEKNKLKPYPKPKRKKSDPPDLNLQKL
jgi:hypothetical protein